MERPRQFQVEALSEAYAYIPSRLHDKLGCDLFCEDPIFAGVLAPPFDNETRADGRNPRRLVCVGWPCHTRDKRMTLIWPKADEPSPLYAAVHELGHVLHGHLADRAGWHRFPLLQAVTQYARGNYAESFAEAFTAWALYSPRTMDESPYWPWGYSRRNAEWFDRLLAA